MVISPTLSMTPVSELIACRPDKRIVIARCGQGALSSGLVIFLGRERFARGLGRMRKPPRRYFRSARNRIGFDVGENCAAGIADAAASLYKNRATAA